MALVEIELRLNTFENMIQFILEKRPIPVSWLAHFRPSRLLSKPFNWQQPVIGENIPGFPTPPGMLTVSVPVKISHISFDELKADANAPHTTTNCTARLVRVLLRISRRTG